MPARTAPCCKQPPELQYLVSLSPFLITLAPLRTFFRTFSFFRTVWSHNFLILQNFLIPASLSPFLILQHCRLVGGLLLTRAHQKELFRKPKEHLPLTAFADLIEKFVGSRLNICRSHFPLNICRSQNFSAREDCFILCWFILQRWLILQRARRLLQKHT